MNLDERYEVKAEAFRIMTGQMAPGKDPPSASYSKPFDERSAMWEQWRKQNGEITRAMEIAFERIMESG